ncbi:RNA-directed DNA polymerase [Neobacillus sp. SCS-31]|uniref:RNA-directed DNA polymerase n=1 Tax=Neobacillus oceani TaxID=3115292 RepID=UPI0039064485
MELEGFSEMNLNGNILLEDRKTVNRMKLKKESIKWAIEHIYNDSDTDLFPKPEEIVIIYKDKENISNKLADLDLSNYIWKPYRRFIIPKTELSYRVATQLDPLDSILLAAIIYEFGQKIENKRVPVSEEKVFNYRFNPSNDGYFYSSYKSWDRFWETCLNKSKKYKFAVYVDIADFYNQIYHHVIENQLINCEFPNAVKNSIMNLLESVTQGVSRGIPIGPHSVHLLAEMSLIPVDNSLLTRGIDFCRYSDDIVLFCDDEIEAQKLVYEIATVLDKQQRLMLQNKKTKIYATADFIDVCENNIKDNPIDELEEEMIGILRNYTTGGYALYLVKKIPPEKMSVFSEENIKKLLDKYLEQAEPDFSRIRWFFRRLSILGTPNAINYVSRNINNLFPAISDICRYFISVAKKQDTSMHDVGEDLINLLDNDLIEINEFFLISILSLFSGTIHFNHIEKIINLYRNSSDIVRRKVILSAYEANKSDWIRELKEDYPRLDVWSKRALLIAASRLPLDEKKFYLNGIKGKLLKSDILDNILIDWAKKS